jgi:hypothetical protein
MNMKMRIVVPWICAVAGWGCSSSDVVNYGPPGGLVGKKLPSRTNASSGGVADAGSSSGGSGSGATGSGSSSGVGGSAGVDSGSGLDGSRTAGGGGPPDAGCPVSWSKQIFPALISTGKAKCSDSGCHGSGLQSPPMTDDPATTYETLASYIMVISPTRLPYISPGNADPKQSGIECNLSGSDCGPQMPLVANGAQTLALSDLQMVDTWIKCGSPNN